MNEERKMKLLLECVDFLVNLWEAETDEEWDYHWQEIIGMTEKEMETFGLKRN